MYHQEPPTTNATDRQIVCAMWSKDEEGGEPNGEGQGRLPSAGWRLGAREERGAVVLVVPGYWRVDGAFSWRRDTSIFRQHRREPGRFDQAPDQSASDRFRSESTLEASTWSWWIFINFSITSIVSLLGIVTFNRSMRNVLQLSANLLDPTRDVSFTLFYLQS